MAARIGISKTQVIDAAEEILTAKGKLEEVSLSEVAQKTGIRVQSLYAHVDGMKGLRREIALRSLKQLAKSVTDAAVGHSGLAAVEAILQAQLTFAITRPGSFTATIHPPGDDQELLDAIEAVQRPLGLVLDRLQVEDPERTHWTRLVLSSIYGFSLLTRDAQLTLPVSPESSGQHVIDVLVSQLEELTPTSLT
jgi:AcrR family transcriptional regulator|tara:strand:- start:400 stop:981 length:582 start_codon:yes stop_codon:yes gene_type:complete